MANYIRTQKGSAPVVAPFCKYNRPYIITQKKKTNILCKGGLADGRGGASPIRSDGGHQP